MLLATVLVPLVVAAGSVIKPADDNFELLILHNNDMHARFQQTSQDGGVCSQAKEDAGECYGGFPRVAHVVKEARKAAETGDGPPVLYLNAGDTYIGTSWFKMYKWKIAAEFVNALKPDAISLGNHEFDEGVNGLAPFIRNLSSPVLAANLISVREPELKNEPNLRKSIIIEKNNVKIGIVGYLTPLTKLSRTAPINKVEFEDEVPAIRREVKLLKEQNVNILIALGHSGFEEDKRIAKEVEDLDLVIGAHTHTLFTNIINSLEKPETREGPYPFEVVQKNGRIVRVVQAYCFTKYMGKLLVTFDSQGEIKKCEGNPLLLNHDIPQDSELLRTVKKFKEGVDLISNEIVGQSLVPLNGQCRTRECNIGNLITDAILNYTRENFQNQYPDVNIAMIQAGRVRNHVVHSGAPFSMTKGDWLAVIPFSDNLAILTINGTVLKQSLEHAVSTWRSRNSTTQFQQFSGMEVVYDLAKPVGSRVVTGKTVCSKCGDNTKQDIKDEYEYKVIMPIFLANGGEGYVMFNKLPRQELHYGDLECVYYYVKKYSPINIQIDGRIQVLNENEV